MAASKVLQCVCVLLAVVTITSAEPKVLRQRGLKRSLDLTAPFLDNAQTPLSDEHAQLAVQRILKNKKNHSAKVKYYTYDNYYLGDIPNITFTSDDMLEYSNYGLFNVDTAQEKGFLNAADSDCAASKPNALKSAVSYGSSAPSVFHSNATALAAYGLSEFFDIIAFTWKPIGPAPDFPSISMNTWRIVEDKHGEKNATLVDSMFAFWFGSGYLPADTIVPGDIFGDDWGERVNFIEIQATADDEQELDFCMDNLVLLFHPEEDKD